MSNDIDLIPYPWQQAQWQTVLQQHEQQRLPHALLLSGARGIGKWHYANTLANYLLCLLPQSGLPCGRCRGCELNASGTHPDRHWVTLEDHSKQIKIDQIRSLSAQVVKTAQQGGVKVAVLGPVESLNINAANALLKVLEEPPADTFFILVSDVISGVMPTVRSRCQIVPMMTPERSVAINWLKDMDVEEHIEALLDFTAGAPLSAKALLEDDLPVKLSDFFGGLLSASGSHHNDIGIAGEWSDIQLSQLILWWIQLIQGLIKQQISKTSTSGIKSEDFISSLLAIYAMAQQMNTQWLYKFLDKLMTIERQLMNGANPNQQLLLEELLLDWYSITRNCYPVDTQRVAG